MFHVEHSGSLKPPDAPDASQILQSCRSEDIDRPTRAVVGRLADNQQSPREQQFSGPVSCELRTSETARRHCLERVRLLSGQDLDVTGKHSHMIVDCERCNGSLQQIRPRSASLDEGHHRLRAAYSDDQSR